MEEFKQLLTIWGLPSSLVVIILLLIQDPERAEKLAKVISKPFFTLFKWFSKFYISKNISLNVSEFINKDLLRLLDDSISKKIKIKLNFVSSKEELRLKKNTIIVRLKEDDDQTRNILSAANIAIPSVVCPFIRSNIDGNLSKAIDLTVLKKLADKLGNHGRFVYKTNFLDPELIENPTINDLIQQLIRIDKKGFFISVFINELNYVGKGTYASSDRANRTAEVIDFLTFLLNIAEREVGEINELEYYSNGFSVGVILLAITEKASSQGLAPYLKRLQRNFYSGCDSVYIVAYSNAWDFLKDLLNAIKADNRYITINTYKLLDNQRKNYGQTKVALIRANKVFHDETLEKHLDALGIGVGSIIEGKITDIATDYAVVSFSNLNGFIKKGECSWYTVSSCSDELQINKSYTLRVKYIDHAIGNIELSRRFDEDDPWQKNAIPVEGNTIEITPFKEVGFYLTCITEDGIEVKLPISEIRWGEVTEADIIRIIGKKSQAKVLIVDEGNRLIRVSLKQLTPNPWEEIKLNFPKGKTIMGKVVAINSQFVSVEISDGIAGRVTKESFSIAGNEYRDFENNLMLGQKLEVVVQKVWVGKEKISLELRRNFSTDRYNNLIHS